MRWICTVSTLILKNSFLLCWKNVLNTHYLYILSLSTYQSWARDNTAATTWPWYQAMLQYLLWLLLVDTETLIFLEFFLVPEAKLRCRVAVVAKLKKCRVPSSATDIFSASNMPSMTARTSFPSYELLLHCLQSVNRFVLVLKGQLLEIQWL